MPDLFACKCCNHKHMTALKTLHSAADGTLLMDMTCISTECNHICSCVQHVNAWKSDWPQVMQCHLHPLGYSQNDRDPLVHHQHCLLPVPQHECKHTLVSIYRMHAGPFGLQLRVKSVSPFMPITNPHLSGRTSTEPELLHTSECTQPAVQHNARSHVSRAACSLTHCQSRTQALEPCCCQYQGEALEKLRLSA